MQQTVQDYSFQGQFRPLKQPTLFLRLSSPSGLGNAIRGGPEAPRTAEWMCVAVLAGDWGGAGDVVEGDVLFTLVFCGVWKIGKGRGGEKGIGK